MSCVPNQVTNVVRASIVCAEHGTARAGGWVTPTYCGDMPPKEYEEISIRQWSLVRPGAVHSRSDLQTCRGDPRLRRTATPGRNSGKRSATRHQCPAPEIRRKSLDWAGGENRAAEGPACADGCGARSADTLGAAGEVVAGPGPAVEDSCWRAPRGCRAGRSRPGWGCTRIRSASGGGGSWPGAWMGWSMRTGRAARRRSAGPGRGRDRGDAGGDPEGCHALVAGLDGEADRG